ncbi:gp53-like domain-containing protein [Xenorhabdus taiwanensis]|uniref:Putative tail fiber protein gp53-like C-terminal domain-containing protein n=1 Tax=Xenorhabdus taiwanensis TaxID=3085177 RepID=A0ABM8JZE4_9GAMM|nr:hypothetical protein TCT1_30050 [Xenorhabdus sp. TCT-1]
MFYSQGTISTVSGSAIVRGTGTRFKSNINGVAPGQVILIRSGNNNLLHMIQAVNSDTELVLADSAFLTLNYAKYQIQTTVPDSISDGVRHLVANNSYITQFLQNMDKWMTQNGTVSVTLPNGQTVSLQSIKALYAAMLDKNKNGADIYDKQAFVKNLGLAGTVDLAKNAYPKTGGVVYGSIDATGYLSSNAVYEAGGIRVYSANNKPTPDDIGAYPKTGGTVNGNVDATGYVSAGKVYEAGGIRVYSPNNPQTEALLETNGWYRDTVNGVIIQWGSGKYRDGQFVRFPRPFTRVVGAVTISANANDAAGFEVVLSYPISLNEFFVGCAVSTGNAFINTVPLNCTWIAIGY